MPCLYVSTNVNVDGVNDDDKAAFFSEATKALSSIIGRPENYVMVILKGSLDITFGGNKEPAALAEVVSMDGIDSNIKRKLIASVGTILQNRFSIPRTRFILKVHDATLAHKLSKL